MKEYFETKNAMGGSSDGVRTGQLSFNLKRSCSDNPVHKTSRFGAEFHFLSNGVSLINRTSFEKVLRYSDRQGLENKM